MKKYLSLILALGICMSMCVFPAAAISANEAENEVLTEDEFTELLTAEMSSNEFGGLYYEGDTLVVNVIASQKATSLRPQLAQKAPEDIDVEYRTVTYSLSELERIKNFLTGYMSDYSIMMLDANEITNQVDISLAERVIAVRLRQIHQIQHSDVVSLPFQIPSGGGQHLHLRVRDHIVAVCFQNVGLDIAAGFGRAAAANDQHIQ